MFHFSKKGPVEYLEAAVLNECDSLIHAFCTRRGGVSEGKFSSLNFSPREGDNSENILQNWQLLATAFNLHVEQFFVVNQVHRDSVLVIDHPVRDYTGCRPLQFDAIITDQPGVAIGIKTADCVPILLADKARRIVGVVHAGWKGTALNISAKVVDALVQRFSCRAEDIVAVIGPSIGPCCYEVDTIVFDAMKSHKDRDSYFYPCREEGRWMLNLPLANKLQITGSGVLPANTYVADCCTSCNTGIFYSHRAEEGNTGRQLNFIMLNTINHPES